MRTHSANNRNLGIDLLRGFAMFLVILWHFVGQGGLLGHAEPGSVKYWILSFVQILACCCVNLYGLTTGYVMCDKSFRLSRITKLWATTVFWSVAVSCLFFELVPESRTIPEMVSMFLPILRGRYWFFTAYVVVMLLSPVLNLVIRSLNKGQFRLLLAALFFLFGVIPVASLGNDVMRISAGHHFSWMIVLYIIGGYLRRFAPAGGAKKWLAGYFLFGGVHLIYKFAATAVELGDFGNLLLTYPSPLIVGEAICLFLYFAEAFSGLSGESLAGKLIRFGAPGVYSIYVIHVHPLIYWNEKILSLFRAWDSWNTPAVCAAMAAAAAVLFTLCICLDAVRQWLFRRVGVDRMIDKLSNKIEKKLRALLGD